MIWVILFDKTIFFPLIEQNKVEEVGETEEILFYFVSLKLMLDILLFLGSLSVLWKTEQKKCDHK